MTPSGDAAGRPKPNKPPARPLPANKARLKLVTTSQPEKPAGTPRLQQRWHRWSVDTFFMRVLGGALLISLPMVVVLGALVVTQGAQTDTDAAKAQTQAIASSAATRISDWVSEREVDLTQVARDSVDHIGRANLNASTLKATSSGYAFDAIEIVDPNGKVVDTSGPAAELPAITTAGWFGKSLTTDMVQPIMQGSPGLVWIMTSPITGFDGNSQGVVVADVNVTALGGLLLPYGASGNASSANREVHVATRDHYLVYSSDWFTLAVDSAMLDRGALKIKVESAIVDQAFARDTGSAQIIDYRHRDVIAGYQSVPSLGLVVIASTNSAAALAPVYSLERLTVLIGVIGTVFIVGFAILLTRLTVRPIMALSHMATVVQAGDMSVRFRPLGGVEMRLLGAAFNAMVERLDGVLTRLRGEVSESAADLSAAAERLAAATFEQTTAATATSTSMEDVARSSAAIADSVDRVAIQAGDARTAMELVEADLQTSGDRTLALVGRVNEIEGILALIDDIADQTNLLALNAAIEAARAGDAGRGFAVVADEVRRLAERSKAASAQIAKLVEGAQAQSTETVIALEKGVKQMKLGLVMMLAMAEVSGQVQQATQQQRASTDEVVRAIEHIAQGSRSVAATAQEIASAAVRQGVLAADLAAPGWQGTPAADVDE